MDWISIISVLLSISSLVFTGLGYYKNRIHAQKLFNQTSANHNSLLFAEYTRRYQEIIVLMPDSVYTGDAKSTDPNVMKFMSLYFDLCSEEFHLRQEGFIPDKVWENWVEGMRLTVKRPIYQTSWTILSQYYNQDFLKFMNHEIINYKPTQP